MGSLTMVHRVSNQSSADFPTLRKMTVIAKGVGFTQFLKGISTSTGVAIGALGSVRMAMGFRLTIKN